MNQRYNRGWKQLNQPSPLCPRPVGSLDTQWLVTRFIKAGVLYATTRYSWHLSWAQAGK